MGLWGDLSGVRKQCSALDWVLSGSQDDLMSQCLNFYPEVCKNEESPVLSLGKEAESLVLAVGEETGSFSWLTKQSCFHCNLSLSGNDYI